MKSETLETKVHATITQQEIVVDLTHEEATINDDDDEVTMKDEKDDNSLGLTESVCATITTLSTTISNALSEVVVDHCHPEVGALCKVRSLIEQYMGPGNENSENPEGKKKRRRGRRRKSSIMTEMERIKQREIELNQALDL